MRLPALIPVPYEGTVYRNIYTCSPAQDLLDDVCDAEDSGLVDTLIQNTSGIDHKETQTNRVFQYGVLDPDLLSVFERGHWNGGRFGDGSAYGVWYASEDELTSISEACWNAYQLGRDNVLQRGEVYTVDRRMFDAQISAGRALDLIGRMEFYEDLIASEDYSEKNFEMIRTPSARRKEGICTPVFLPHVIKKNAYLYDLKLYINPNGLMTVSSPHEEMNFTVQARDLVLIQR